MFESKFLESSERLGGDSSEKHPMKLSSNEQKRSFPTVFDSFRRAY